MDPATTDREPPALGEDRAFEAILERLAAAPALEREWVDLLSQLEYAGCRKIVKGVEFADVSLEVLRHVSEEASHAFLLKRAAEESGLPRRSWTEGRFAEIGWTYFQTLDRTISAMPVDPAHRYPGVSWAVERRVLSLYPAYLRITRNEAVRSAVRRILAQERRHAARFGEAPFPPGFLARAAEVEERLWAAFTRELNLRLNPDSL
jgi:hypothetical protein